MPRFAEVQRDDPEEAEATSSDEEEQPEERDAQGEPSDDEEKVEHELDEAGDMPAGLGLEDRKKLRISLKKKGTGAQVCHVCGRSGHAAGFVNGGTVYLDCPMKPCYLCKEPGHTTMTCPHRIAPEHGCAQASTVSKGNLLQNIWQRQADGRTREVAPPVRRWQVDSALLKLFPRRITCLQFHPWRDDVVLAADKKGSVALWDFQKVTERTVYKPHTAIIFNIRHLSQFPGEQFASSSQDGRVRIWDAETGNAETAMNLNPNGWISMALWQQFLGMDVSPVGCLLAGDSMGRLHFVDPRTPGGSFAAPQIHKRVKINSVHVHPLDGNLVLTGSNDHTARISDVRALSTALSSTSGSSAGSGAPEATVVACMDHPKVVNSAYFSPRTGSKILTTCIDNRLRVWDSIWDANQLPSRAIVHSHDFNRHLSPFRAEWDPKDPAERVVVAGRYISEDFGGVKLHPVDLMDAATGRLLAELTDPNLPYICTVNKPHPRLDVIVTGASGSMYAWRPRAGDQEEEKSREAAAEERRRASATGVGSGGGTLGGTGGFLFFDANDPSDQKKKRKSAAATETDTPEKSKDKGPPKRSPKK
mmetsp:Transcript_9398/g.28271  ORF Transcript_9398/g.28271 Transcript_9398/m.28271 type:complete len:589 (+) Transcript_9398:319-2085(+)